MMTTQTAISSVRKLAIGCGLVAGAALITVLVFSVQVVRAKKEYQDYDLRVMQPERQKWQSAASAPVVGERIEPLPSLPVGLFEEERRLAMELSVVTFRRDVALDAGITVCILSALMFAYHGALKIRVPIQSPQTTTGSSAPGRV